ncbi:MAG: hypothetical protein JOZ19_11635 [Rubrobacter sp.]|nr:hypothetical protein [Rubrobacter sp.]
MDEGTVRFFLVPDMERMGEMMSEYASSPPSGQQQALEGFLSSGQNESTNWVQDNCEQVSQELWQPPSSSDQEGGRGPGMMRAQML